MRSSASRRWRALLAGLGIIVLASTSCASWRAGSTRRSSASAGWPRARVARGAPHAAVDPRALGYSLTVIVRMRPAPGQLSSAAQLAVRTPEVVECHRVTGEDCCVMEAHVRDVLHLEEVIDRFAVLGQTTTSVVQSSPVPARGLALSDA